MYIHTPTLLLGTLRMCPEGPSFSLPFYPTSSRYTPPALEGDGWRRRRRRRRARNSGWLVGWYGRFVRRTGERRERSHSQSSPLIFFLFLLRQRRQTRKGKKSFRQSRARARPQATTHKKVRRQRRFSLGRFFFASRGATKLSLLFGEGGYFFLQFASFFTGLVYKVLLCHTKKGALQYVDLDIMHRYHQLSFEKEVISSNFNSPLNFPESQFVIHAFLSKKASFSFFLFLDRRFTDSLNARRQSEKRGERKEGGRDRAKRLLLLFLFPSLGRLNCSTMKVG